MTPGLSRIEGYVIVLKVAGPVVIEEGEYQGVRRVFRHTKQLKKREGAKARRAADVYLEEEIGT